MVNPVPSSALVNGSFELDYTGWTHTGNQLVLQLPVTDPYVASDGSKIVVFNKGSTIPNGVLSQTIATIPGQAYQLQFDMGILAYKSDPQRLKVDLTGSSLLLSQTFTMVRSGSSIFRRETKAMGFTANSGNTTISFKDVSQATNSINLTLDNVRITPAPTGMVAMAAAPAAMMEGNDAFQPATQAAAATLPPDQAWLGGQPGDCIIRVNGSTPGCYVLERSPDLRSWEAIEKRYLEVPGLLEFNDTQGLPGWNAVFYRVELPEADADQR
jgi:hypothetical protein